MEYKRREDNKQILLVKLEKESTMDSPSNPSTMAHSVSSWDYIILFLIRPFSAIAFTLFVLAFGWTLAWKLVLVHVPLVQEIFGLRKKPSKPEPPKRRFSQYYNSIDASRNQLPPR